MLVESHVDPLAIHYDTYAGDVYTITDSSLILTNGTLTANTITDGTQSLTGGEFTADLIPDADGTLNIGVTTPTLKRWLSGEFSLFVGIDTMVISGGTIVDSTGFISFNNEALSTTSSFTLNELIASAASVITSDAFNITGDNQATIETDAVDVLTVTGGKGGSATGGGNTAGKGSDASITAGDGGDATSGATGGTGGDVNIISGDRGIGSGGFGVGGDVNIKTPDGLLEADTGNILLETGGNAISNKSGDITIKIGAKHAAGGSTTGVITFGDGGVTDFTQIDVGGSLTQVGTAVATIGDTVAAALTIGTGAAGVDYILTFNGENNDGLITWMEDEDYFKFGDDIGLVSGEFLVFDKASGNGVKVDLVTPTFGFADLLGDQFSKNTGGTKPTLTAYNGAVDAWQFTNGDEAFLTYHIPHDYVKGTDIHLHVHWSQNAAGATGGTIDFKYFAIYSKGWNQASGSAFTTTPITATFATIDINDGGSGLNQYQQHITEITISAATATAALFDRDDFEPDGVIELTLEMDADNLTGTASSPFIHYVDIHYQTNSVIGTKNRTPDFYS